MGLYSTPYLYIWKDSLIKLFVTMNDATDYVQPVAPGDVCNAHYWKAAKISSGVSGITSYTTFDECGDGSGGGFLPYVASGYSGQMSIQKNLLP